MDGRVRAETAREVELLFAHAVGDQRSRGVEAAESQRERAERADADDADRVARPRACSLETAEDAGGGLDERAGGERDAFGQAVHDVARNAHELPVAAAARESDLVVVQAQLGIALLAAAAAIAGDHSFADDPVT